RVVAGERGEPSQVRPAPVGALAVDEATAGEELEDVVAALDQLPLQRLPAADDITYALLGLRRDADRGEVARAVVVGELGSVVPIVLALVPRLPGDEGGGDDVARVAPV